MERPELWQCRRPRNAVHSRLPLPECGLRVRKQGMNVVNTMLLARDGVMAASHCALRPVCLAGEVSSAPAATCSPSVQHGKYAAVTPLLPEQLGQHCIDMLPQRIDLQRSGSPFGRDMFLFLFLFVPRCHDGMCSP